MDIRVLGPVELHAAGRGQLLGSGKTVHLLAALAHDVGRPVSLGLLARRLWDDPPVRAREALHTSASRLRALLRATAGSAGLDPADVPRISQHAHTYTLETDPDRVDLHRFQRLASQARALSDSASDHQALALLREAEALWRGEPLAGLPGGWAEGVRAALEERHLAVTLTRVSVELRLGRFGELIPELVALTEQHPLDETLAGHLMVAAYGAGRHAQALRAYEAVRRGLDQELGSVPGEHLKRLHGLILDQVPVSELFPTQVGTAPRVSAPDNFPLHGELVGRERELAAISAAAESGAVLSLQTISGMGGVGKSLLALHAAERLSTRYPDGRVFVNLLGHTPGQRPLSPQAALALLLRLLGVPARRIPVELDDLIAEWRTLMANRRVVLVLDDAADPDQLRPLIPGQSPSLVIVTSRGRLHGLPGIRRVMLDVLSPADAAIMFRRLVENPDRASRSAEVAEIVRICGNLPLAIELAASRFNSRLTWDLAHLIHRLSHGDNRLLEFHDQTRELAQVFGMSYQALTHEQRKAFRLLSLALGQDFGTQAAAALLDLPAARTERLLEGLLDLHLLREPVAERYTAHDLLREFARTLTEAEDSEADRRLAVGRLVDFYIRAADRADRLLFPERARFPVTGDTTEDGLPHWDGPSDAEAWFTAESTALLDAERWARTHGHARQAALLAHALGGFLDAEGLWRDAQRVHGHAVRHWQQAGDRRAETRARIDLAAAETHVGRYDRAISTTEAALALARADSDTEGEAEALQHLALMLWSQGRLDSALSTQRRCLALRERGGSDRQVARAVNNLAIFLLYLGRYSEAKEFFDAALSESRRLGDHRAEALVLNNMGDLYNHMGEKELARRSLEHSLAISRTSARKADLAAVQVTLANSMEIPAELDSALDLYRQALICFRELGDRRREVDTMNGIGLAFRTAGRLAEAAAHHATAADLAHSIGAALEESHSLHELGITEYRMNAPASAAAHLRAALALAREIGAPEEEARAAAGLSEILGSRE